MGEKLQRRVMLIPLKNIAAQEPGGDRQIELK